MTTWLTTHYPKEGIDKFQWCIPCRDVRIGRVKPEALDKILGPGFAKLPMIKGGIRAPSDTQAERMVREFVAET